MAVEVIFQCDICHRYVKGEPVVVHAGLVVGTLEVCESCDKRDPDPDPEA